jgi:hypothetical protein
MKRSGPLKRGKPLKRSQLNRTGEKPLKSDPAKVWDWKNRSNSKPLPHKSPQREEETPERQKLVREMLRLHPRCGAGIPFCCTKDSTECNEIVRRSQWRAGYLERANVVTLCHNCHAYITTHAPWAKNHGHQIDGAIHDQPAKYERASYFAMLIRRATRYRCDTDCTINHRDNPPKDIHR